MTVVWQERPTLAAAVLHAQRLIREVDTADGLRHAADVLADAARRVGCSALTPASSSSAGVVAAAVMLSDGALKQATEADLLCRAINRVLLVEVAAVSGMTVRARAASLRAAGASWIGLVVMHDLSVDAAALSKHRFGDVDELVPPRLIATV